MKQQMLSLTVVLTTLLGTGAYAIPAIPTGTYTVDGAHSEVSFEVAHMGISSVDGKFDKFSGTINVTDKNVDLNADIDTASVNTGNAKRDGHLQSPDFFDAAKNKSITFKSTKALVTKNDAKVTGDLTIHGVTKPVTLKGKITGPIKDFAGGQRIGFKFTGEINRKDFGLTWNKLMEGVSVVGEKVTLNIQGEAFTAPPAAAASAAK